MYSTWVLGLWSAAKWTFLARKVLCICLNLPHIGNIHLLHLYTNIVPWPLAHLQWVFGRAKKSWYPKPTSNPSSHRQTQEYSHEHTQSHRSSHIGESSFTSKKSLTASAYGYQGPAIQARRSIRASAKLRLNEAKRTPSDQVKKLWEVSL